MINIHYLPKAIFAVFLLLSFSARISLAQSSITLAEGTVLTISTVPAALSNPWEIIQITDNIVWVTERNIAQVSEVNLITGEKSTLLTIPPEDIVDPQFAGVSGILGMVLHPDFHDGTQELFISYTSLHYTQRLAKYELMDGALVNPEIILETVEIASNHGSRLMVAHDRTILMSTGSEDDDRPQALTNMIGKWLRVNLDGSAPTDNPFYDAQNPDAPQCFIYSYGHRNPQGITQLPADDPQFPGYIYAPEHGNIQNDELNRIVSGRNYGWADHEGWTDQVTDSNYPPLVTFDLAPTDLEWYEHPAIPEWNRKLLMGTSKGQQLVFWSLTADGQDVEERNPDGASSNNASLSSPENTISIFVGEYTTSPRCITALPDGRVLLGAYVNGPSDEDPDRILILENQAFSPPAVTWSPSILSFGSVEGGIHTMNATLTNESDATVSIESIDVSPTSTGFTLEGTIELPVSLEAAASLQVTVRFEGYSSGSYTANLVAMASGESYSLNLNATVANPNAGNSIQLEQTLVTISTLTDQVVRPWDIELAPDGNLWVTERDAGTVAIINTTTGSRQVIHTMASEDMPPSVGSTAGLLGMTLHPDFEGNHPWVYLAHTDVNNHQALSRFTWNGSALTERQRLLTVEDDVTLYGSRVKFLPDGTILWTTGSNGDLAQEANSLAGKTLRLNDDGTVPADNPFASSQNANERFVYTLGHRNPQGLTVIPSGGNGSESSYIISEHGGVANDEINFLSAGQNYGWPDYEGWTAEVTADNHPPMVTFDLAPTGIAYYNHPAIPEWNNSLLMGSNKGQRMMVLRLTDQLGIEDHNELLDQENTLELTDDNQVFIYNEGIADRPRDIEVSADGKVYLAMFGNGGDRIVVLENTAYSNPLSVKADKNGLDEIVQIYPNPFNAFLNLHVAQQATITMTNLTGATIFNQALAPGNHQISTHDHTPGLYLITVKTVTAVATFKVLK